MSTTALQREPVKVQERSGCSGLSNAERNVLILRHMAFARSLARRYANRGEPLDDLEQVAAIGLLKAVERYDPSRGEFRAFATPTILGEIRRHFRDRTWTIRPGRGVQDASARVQRATDDLTSRLGRSPSTSEIAKEVDLTDDEVLDALAARSAYRPTSLSAPLHGDDENGETLAILFDDEGFDRAEDRLLVNSAMARLPARARAILILRFRDDLTQAEIATKLEISQMHVSRLLRKALEDLRAQVPAAPPGA